MCQILCDLKYGTPKDEYQLMLLYYSVLLSIVITTIVLLMQVLFALMPGMKYTVIFHQASLIN